MIGQITGALASGGINISDIDVYKRQLSGSRMGTASLRAQAGTGGNYAAVS